MKISSSLLVIWFILILIFAACIKKPNDPVAITDDMYPEAPQNLTATFGDGNITLSWQMQDTIDIAKYFIFRKDSINQEFQLIDSSVVRTFTDNFLDNNNVDYFYQVSAINLKGFQGPRSIPIQIRSGLYGVIINNGEQYTDSLSVTLTFIAPGTVSLIKICNDSLFENTTWEPFINPRRWRLTGVDGIKTVYVKFRDEFGNETSTPATDNIILDTKALISLVTENTGGEVKTLGDTIHFTIVSNEINGFATINIGEVIKGITLYDDGTYGDVTPHDGCYEVDYIITKDFTAINALIIGNFVDQVGNVALPVAAAGRISVQRFPTPVFLFDPVVDGTTIYLSWTQNNDTDFSSYRVYRSKLPGIDSSLPAIAVIIDRTTNYYRDEGLEFSTLFYYYRVYVYNESGQSVGSNEVVGTTIPNTIPNKVIVSEPILVNDTTLRLTWTQNNDDDFAFYYIFRSESSPVDTNAAPVIIINTQKTTLYDDKNLARNTEYFYRVFVYDKGGLCAGSEEVSGRTAP